MSEVIFVLSKGGPHPNRSGPDGIQDWYQNLVLAAELWRKDTTRIVLLCSAFHHKDSRQSELEQHLTALIKLGVPADNIVCLKKGYETVGQIKAAVDYVQTEGHRLIVVATALHMPRARCLVKWLGYSDATYEENRYGEHRSDEVRIDENLNIIFVTAYRLWMFSLFMKFWNWYTENRLIPDRKAGNL